MHENSKPTPFYIVSMSKFTALYLGTMGLYGLYWFYKNWQLLGQHQQRNYTPALRALFHVIFFPSLCNKLVLHEKSVGQHYHWNPTYIGFGFVFLEVTSVILSYLYFQDQIAAGWLLLQYPILVGNYYFLYKFQLVANRVSEDPYGKGNQQLTPINHAWIIFGILHWLRQGYILYAILTGQLPEV